MKTKRVKNYRRTIDLYDTHFGLKTNPLEILVDSTFARQALIQQLHIEQQFKCTLSCEFILVTSSCIILECEKLGQLFSGALQIIQQYKVLKCTHKVHKDTSAFSCIKRRILTARSKKCSETKSRKGSLLFALASNDELLQQYARTVPGMPIFFIAHKRINLESIPTPVSLLLQQKATRAPDLTLSELISLLNLALRNLNRPLHLCANMVWQLELMYCSKIKQFCDRFGFSEESFTRRKKTKGPNPLSCKQKLHKPYILKRTTTKRKRKRIKMTWAMKQVVERLKTEQSSKDA